MEVNNFRRESVEKCKWKKYDDDLFIPLCVSRSDGLIAYPKYRKFPDTCYFCGNEIEEID